MPPTAASHGPLDRPSDRLTVADLFGMALFGAAVFIFVWWLRFWLGWWFWLAGAVWGWL